MGSKAQDTELLEAVKVTSTEYRALSEQYEQLLDYAKRAHGSSAMVGALHCATELGTHVSMALRRYLDAVEILAVFYEDVYSAGENGSDADTANYAVAVMVDSSGA